jgi:hypothetical protein
LHRARQVRVVAGQKVKLTARHTDASVQLAVRDVPEADLTYIGHIDEVRSALRMSVGAATCGATVHLLSTSAALAKSGGGKKALAAAARDLASFEAAVVARPSAYNA